MNYLFLALISLSVFGATATPTLVFAQTSAQESHRTTLLQLIDLLTLQIAQLQQQLEVRQEVAKSTPSQISRFSNNLDWPVDARYQISGDLDSNDISNTKHRRYFKRVLEIFPDEYEDKLKEFVVFLDQDGLVDAYIETIPPVNEYWSFAVTSDLVDNVDSKDNTFLVTHEFAHVLAYEEPAVVIQPAISSCGEYFDSQVCPRPNSYLEGFVQEFWSEDDLKRAQKTIDDTNQLDDLYEYYLEHESEFVTDYAALNPEEDFAESFVEFVFAEKPTNNDIKSQKVLFFYQYPQLRSLKSEILSVQ